MSLAARIAVVDGGSFVLPYDLQLVTALAQLGADVNFHGSETRYNAECLDAMRRLLRVRVTSRAISGSVASKAQGAWNYLRLLAGVWRGRHLVDIVNFQFSAFWPFELPVMWALGRRVVLTVHNAVPHGFGGHRHRPTQWMASLAHRLIFPSAFTRDDFLRRYGERFAARAVVVPHGLLPAAPGLAPVPYRPVPAPRALIYWSTVKPYKGVELFAELARSPLIRDEGVGLEVRGAWAASLLPLRETLRAFGVVVVDTYLDAEALQALFARDAVFLLPYREASQSGALSTLLQHGCTFICTDVGDMGAFMRRFGLDALLLKETTADAVAAALSHLRENAPAIARAFQAAQDASDWAALGPSLSQAYAMPVRARAVAR